MSIALALAVTLSIPRFAEHTVATDLKGGYHVVIADMNGDGKPDLVALASGMTELYWFENPSWERHVIASGLKGMINVAARDLDGDGIPELALATGWANPGPQQAERSTGTVSLLKHNRDPRQPWAMTEIDRLPTSHRLRWAQLDRIGPVLVNAPLIGAGSEQPEYRGSVPLVFYKPGEWKRQVITDAGHGVMHGIYVPGPNTVLTASFEGIHRLDYKHGRWTRTQIAAGDPSAWPKGGSSDVATGRIGKRQFICAIEPWHGNQVTVYAPERHVIDDSLLDGHTIATADLNHDGRYEIIAGFRGKGRSVYIYYADDKPDAHWTRHVLDDGGMAAASCAVADLNGDGRLDIACIGSATANLKWYENLQPPVAERLDGGGRYIAGR
jgi:hypothetical protein